MKRGDSDIVNAMLNMESSAYCCDGEYLFQRNNASGKALRLDRTSAAAAVDECVYFINSLSLTGGMDGTPPAIPRSPALGSAFRRREACTSPASVVTKAALHHSQHSSQTAFGERPKRLNKEEVIHDLRDWRRQMVEWSFTVVDAVGLDRTNVTIAFSFLDRYLSLRSAIAPMGRDIVQLMSIACLYLAVKTFEPGRRLPVGEVIKLCGGLYDVKTIETAELHIADTLDWRLCPPTTVTFAGYLTQLVPVSQIQRQRIHRLCREVMDASLADSFYVPHKPSNVAVCSIVIAILRNGEESHAEKSPQAVAQQFLSNVNDMTDIDMMSDETFAVMQHLEHKSQFSIYRQKI